MCWACHGSPSRFASGDVSEGSVIRSRTRAGRHYIVVAAATAPKIESGHLAAVRAGQHVSAFTWRRDGMGTSEHQSRFSAVNGKPETSQVCTVNSAYFKPMWKGKKLVEKSHFTDIHAMKSDFQSVNPSVGLRSWYATFL